MTIRRNTQVIKKAPPPREHNTQASYFEWVERKAQGDIRYRNICSIPNGAKLGKDPRLAAIQMAILKKEGLKVGMPDVLIFQTIVRPDKLIVYPGAFIEFKRGKQGKLSEKQSELLPILTDLGWPVLVARYIEEAITFTERYFDLEYRTRTQKLPAV